MIPLLPLHRLPRPVQIGCVVLPGAFTSSVLLLAQQRTAPRSAVIEREGRADDEPSRGLRLPTASECALPLALGGAVAGVGAASISLDRGIEKLLRRRGVTVPRLPMGLAYGALMLAVNVLANRAPAAEVTPSLEHRVLELLTEAGPMELTPGPLDGTPADEHRPEAEAIAVILRADGAITGVRLDEVWQDWFSRPLTALIGSERVTALVEALKALSTPTAE